MLSPVQELQLKSLVNRINEDISFNVLQGKSIGYQIDRLKEVNSLISAIEYKVPYDLILAQFNCLMNKKGGL